MVVTRVLDDLYGNLKMITKNLYCEKVGTSNNTNSIKKTIIFGIKNTLSARIKSFFYFNRNQFFNKLHHKFLVKTIKSGKLLLTDFRFLSMSKSFLNTILVFLLRSGVYNRMFVGGLLKNLLYISYKKFFKIDSGPRLGTGRPFRSVLGFLTEKNLISETTILHPLSKLMQLNRLFYNIIIMQRKVSCIFLRKSFASFFIMVRKSFLSNYNTKLKMPKFKYMKFQKKFSNRRRTVRRFRSRLSPVSQYSISTSLDK